MVLVDLGVKVDGTLHCDLLLSHQLSHTIHHVSSEFIFQKTVTHHRGNARFSDINIAQGSVATPLRCGGICNNLLLQICGYSPGLDC